MSDPPVQTVTGPIAASDLGVTLAHEHVLLKNDGLWRGPDHPEAAQFGPGRPVTPADRWQLRDDPFLSLDNVRLDDEQLAVDEVLPFREAGGCTILDPTCRGMGSDPEGLARVSAATGVQIVAGSGWYLEQTHPPEVRVSSVDQLAAIIVEDVEHGLEDTGVRAGFIGEIGVSPQFTPTEEKVLRAAARAQARTCVPLSVHLPGFVRYGQRVLDVIESEGGNLGATVLCHMNPSCHDPAYQLALAERGAWLEYDMLGMSFYYPGDGQSPSDDDAVQGLRAVIAGGFGDRLLLSGDVFLKIMLRKYGGNGYAHVLTSFVPRLQRAGFSQESVDGMLTHNPRLLFAEAANR